MRFLNALLILLVALPALGDYEMQILVGGEPLAEYEHRGTTYIEALRGREFSIRLTNPTPHRVAVALSVDGLNTIDARHTDAWGASKWVLGPYESTTIDGWQISDRAARRFFFTGERNSYGAALGKTQNLGIIEAVFFRERRARWEEGIYHHRPGTEAPAPRGDAEAQPRAEAPSAGAAQAKPSDDYAATGMGGRTRHEVEEVSVELERTPVARASIRYEFRPQLVKLGVLSPERSPMERRKRAKGFQRYCSEVP